MRYVNIEIDLNEIDTEDMIAYISEELSRCKDKHLIGNEKYKREAQKLADQLYRVLGVKASIHNPLSQLPIYTLADKIRFEEMMENFHTKKQD